LADRVVATFIIRSSVADKRGVALELRAWRSPPHQQRDAYTFEDRGLIEVKGKGPSRTYFLVDGLSP